MMLYTYDPSLILEEDHNQMRFELGDCEVDGGRETCALCDEEYTAMILKAKLEGKSWKWAKYYCLKAIKMKYSHEVDTSIGGMSLSLSQRYERWSAMCDKIEKELKTGSMTASVIRNLGGVGGNLDNGHYFHYDMGANPSVSRTDNQLSGYPYKE